MRNRPHALADLHPADVNQMTFQDQHLTHPKQSRYWFFSCPVAQVVAGVADVPHLPEDASDTADVGVAPNQGLEPLPSPKRETVTVGANVVTADDGQTLAPTRSSILILPEPKIGHAFGRH